MIVLRCNMPVTSNNAVGPQRVYARTTSVTMLWRCAPDADILGQRIDIHTLKSRPLLCCLPLSRHVRRLLLAAFVRASWQVGAGCTMACMMGVVNILASYSALAWYTVCRSACGWHWMRLSTYDMLTNARRRTRLDSDCRDAIPRFFHMGTSYIRDAATPHNFFELVPKHDHDELSMECIAVVAMCMPT
jgi:hypothetical protein